MADQEKAPKLHENGVLTLDGMKATIKNGGSVLHGGKIITKEADLPTAAELAKGNPVEEKKVLTELQRQQKELQAQIDDLKKSSSQGNSSNLTTPPPDLNQGQQTPPQ